MNLTSECSCGLHGDEFVAFTTGANKILKINNFDRRIKSSNPGSNAFGPNV